DLVLGPTSDGGFWGIGLRRPRSGLLRDVAWSSDQTLRDTLERARGECLRVELLHSWTDVDDPEDLEVLATQIEQLRAKGNVHTARHTERALRALGGGAP
ncbi:MAG: DUF2064 domain-containing protein, partial [Candidatus Latescibacterota bacterium]